METKDRWISGVENSLNGLQAAEGNPFLYSKILNRLEQKKSDYTPARLVWLTAVSFLVLAILNFTAIKMLQIRPKQKNTELQMLSEQFQLLNTNTFTYN